ncbi:MAG: cyclohexa-1,5-dienecarbonyl-CoA hydratase [Arenicellales bacterium]|mgnify:FL=1|jgi:cyclohexa-1,5-dienecarbonyl-CoA hydratase|nr:cyclohexa-1,5-dienecarbonyl-CoA hydratase [Arenicellales bacterium]|tara:strand:+ start:2494 stop:3264 length:771 start_codon:yes stop_codon:yes gene_type:complete
MTTSPVKVSLERDAALLTLTLARPKSNIIDRSMVEALQTALDRHAHEPTLHAILLTAEGPHFSFGASVEEHLPGECEQMLKSLHQLVLTLLDSPTPVLAAVQGQCLGGGLELACAAHLLFASPDAALGQPEIQLAVFAPAASCLLPELIGPAAASDLLLSGRTISGIEAQACGLVSALDDDPAALALAYFDRHLAPRSAASLRLATRALRADLASRVRIRLAAVEKLYLDELMTSHDAVEGLEAFLQKRAPRWQHR